MKGDRVYIIGAGGHAKVVAEIVQQQGHALCGFLDDDLTLVGQTLLEMPIYGPISILEQLEFDGIIIGIGNNTARQKISKELSKINKDFWIQARHSSTMVSTYASIGKGTVLVAGSIINVDSKIGKHCIINTGATVDHDCIIGDYAHICPGAHLAGNVTVGKGALIGVGASIIPGCIIGDWAIVGAGATVISDVPARTIVIGTPARSLSQSG